MFHAEAARTKAAERYLLGELTQEERAAFEEHFFDCVQCAAEVRAAAQFADNCRSLLSERRTAAAPRAPSRWPAWLLGTRSLASIAALAAAVVVIVYQNVATIPELRRSTAPRALTAFSFVPFGSRGPVAQTIVAPREQPFLILFDIPPGGQSSTYTCRIVAEDGHPVFVVDVSAAQARDTVQLLIPAGRLAPGQYTLEVSGQPGGGGGASAAAVRIPFVLRVAG